MEVEVDIFLDRMMREKWLGSLLLVVFGIFTHALGNLIKFWSHSPRSSSLLCSGYSQMCQLNHEHNLDFEFLSGQNRRCQH